MVGSKFASSSQLSSLARCRFVEFGCSGSGMHESCHLLPVNLSGRICELFFFWSLLGDGLHNTDSIELNRIFAGLAEHHVSLLHRGPVLGN